MNCRHCKTPLTHLFVDLGSSPPSNAYLTKDDLLCPEKYYPLKVMVCDKCWLVQTIDCPKCNELFCDNYAYFSSISKTWLKHASDYSKQIIEKLQLNKDSFVIEVASNDGYLLRNFVEANIPCLGIEPTASTANEAIKLGIPVLREFFTAELAKRLADEGRQADLIIGNNVYAHVPDINDFTRGLKAALKPGGTITLEFPHLMQLIEHTQFDTIYHEHFSYLSLYTVARIFDAAGLRVFDVEELPTHGGSLRVYGCHADDPRPTSQAVAELLAREESRGLRELATYQGFQERAERIKDDLLLFLIGQKRAGRKVAAYGAAAKGNTLLNFAGVRRDLLPYVVDRNPAKQGKFLPGSHIPIVAEERLQQDQPEYIVILPWNLREEVMSQLEYARTWGAVFVTAVPELTII